MFYFHFNNKEFQVLVFWVLNILGVFSYRDLLDKSFVITRNHSKFVTLIYCTFLRVEFLDFFRKDSFSWKRCWFGCSVCVLKKKRKESFCVQFVLYVFFSLKLRYHLCIWEKNVFLIAIYSWFAIYMFFLYRYILYVLFYLENIKLSESDLINQGCQDNN